MGQRAPAVLPICISGNSLISTVAYSVCQQVQTGLLSYWRAEIGIVAACVQSPFVCRHAVQEQPASWNPFVHTSQVLHPLIHWWASISPQLVPVADSACALAKGLTLHKSFPSA